MSAEPTGAGITALLGPTNTGKTYRTIERLLEHSSGIIGLPLRLLAREVYDRVTARVGEDAVALVTGEEKRVPARPRYWVCTVESMPLDVEVDFLAVDEIQLAAHRQRGHTFTDRLLHARGRIETWFLGSDTMAPILEQVVPTAVVRRHPRLSQLSWIGGMALSSLPPRTAVVAFSAEDVYAIAERLRTRFGGTAVVLGALSPRTRNAQVAMYQAGEVNHIVATDAIGMGLNLEVDRVVFAALDKYDGHEHRALETAELAQIAGRAGRYTNDGGFGVLRPLRDLPPHVVGDLENHRFPPVRKLVWRNSDLDFASIDDLLASLRRSPWRPAFRLVEQADDFEALGRLGQRPDIRARARDRESIELLWEVCRIPDFRKLLLDSHVDLLGAIYLQVSGPGGAIDPDWMATRIARLDTTEGDIDTLLARLAAVRTWTYVTHRAAWVQDAGTWQARTRAIEDRTSDALHERLTERFVERTSAHRRRPRADSAFSGLAALRDAMEPEPESFIDTLVDAHTEAIAFDDDLAIRFADTVVGHLRKGPDVLHPEVVVLDRADLGDGARVQVRRRLEAWVRDAIASTFADLRRGPESSRAETRGLLYQLEQGLGTIEVASAREQVDRLSASDREALLEAGVVIGRRHAYLRAALEPAAVRTRAALWVAHAQPDEPPRVPRVPAVCDVARGDPSFYMHVGYPVVGPRCVRVDVLQTLLDRLVALGAGPFALPEDLGTLLDLRARTLAAVVGALGWRRTPEGFLAPSRGRRRRRSR